MRSVCVAAAIAIVVAMTSACTKTVSGAAVLPPGTDPHAEIALTDDGYGIQIGEPFAPSAIEIFTEPQCPHCADLQFFFGSDLADFVDDGDLVVTYRFLTFLDSEPRRYSRMVSNAMFLAAAPQAGVTAEDFQGFVEEVYWDTDPDADDEWLADVADMSGLPSRVVSKIAAGAQGVDVEAMNRENSRLLEAITSEVATPTVYDLNTKTVIDVDNYDWLEEVIADR